MQKNFSSPCTGCTSGEIPSREQSDKSHQWKLSDIFASKTDWEHARQTIKERLPELQSFQGTLANADKLLACLTLSDEIDQMLEAVFGYARMHQDTDTANTEYQAMTASVLPLLDEVSSAASFIQPELLSLPEKTVQSLPTAPPGLKKYTFMLQEILRQKQHILSPAEENFLAQTGEIRQTAVNTYTIMTNADLKFPDTLAEDDTRQPLAESRYTRYSRSRNRAVRQDAFHNLFTTYASFRNTFASLYNASMKSSQFIARSRHYDSMLAMALDAGNIPLSVYDTTITATHKALPLLHRYMTLKKRLLKLDDLHMYDLYVPVIETPEHNYPYEECLQLLRTALQPLGDTYRKDMFTGIRSGWIDLYENKGKRSGAYSWGIYGIHPFILTSYNGQYNAVSTIAHELGHSMHSFYSSHAQDYVNADYTIFCAEVASTTNENLLLEHMLKNSAPTEHLYFINQYLEQIRTTVYRQVLFAEFEKCTHAMLEQGTAITADALENLWLDLNRTYYGPDLILDEEIRAEWSRIPHFYRPFYVYQYATGYAAAVTLSQNLRTNGKTAQTAYLNYLASGGSDYSIPLLQRAGVDMTSSQPLETTFARFAACLDELDTATR